MNFFAELKRRKVFKVGAAYLVIAWLAVQVASIGFPAFAAPQWALRVFILVLLLGFPIAVVLTWALDVTHEGVKLDTAGAGTKRLVGTAVVLVALALAWYFLGQPAVRFRDESAAVAGDPSEKAKRGDAAAAIVPNKSIAVLAFTDLSPGHDQEYFSDGIAEEILNALVRIQDLKVAGRTSSFHFKGRNTDLREIGKALGVAHVLEGSVRKQGDKVRITAQLIRTDDGFHLWSDTYDGELTDVFKLQERIAREIADKLAVTLQGEHDQIVIPVATTNPEAYALYLQATGIFNRREGARFPEAIAQLQQALALDPKFARAHARLATLYALAPLYDVRTTSASRAAVERHAHQAIALDASLAEPHAALGQVYSQQRRLVEAHVAYERALAIEPSDVTANFWFATLLVTTGYKRRGNEILDRVLAMDPMLPNALFWRGTDYARNGDVANADRLLKRAVDAGLTHVGLGLSALAEDRGETEEAIRQLAASIQPFNMGDFPAGSAELFARACLGDAPARARSLALLERYLASRPAVVSGVAPFVLIRIDRPALALTAAQNPTSNDALFFAYLWSPRGQNARVLPEFPEFVRRIGLTKLWDRYGDPDACRKQANGAYVCG